MNRKILVIDENEEIHESYKITLKSETEEVNKEKINFINMVQDFFGVSGKEEKSTIEYEVDGVSSTLEAKNKIEESLESQSPYSLILIDIQSTVGGDEVKGLHNLLELDPNLYAIIVSAIPLSYWEELRNLIGDKYLTRSFFLKKPFNGLVLKQSVFLLNSFWNKKQS